MCGKRAWEPDDSLLMLPLCCQAHTPIPAVSRDLAGSTYEGNKLLWRHLVRGLPRGWYLVCPAWTGLQVQRVLGNLAAAGLHPSAAARGALLAAATAERRLLMQAGHIPQCYQMLHCCAQLCTARCLP